MLMASQLEWEAEYETRVCDPAKQLPVYYDDPVDSFDCDLLWQNEEVTKTILAMTKDFFEAWLALDEWDQKIFAHLIVSPHMSAGEMADECKRSKTGTYQRLRRMASKPIFASLMRNIASQTKNDTDTSDGKD